MFIPRSEKTHRLVTETASRDTAERARLTTPNLAVDD
jgi:hypothetical protein